MALPNLEADYQQAPALPWHKDEFYVISPTKGYEKVSSSFPSYETVKTAAINMAIINPDCWEGTIVRAITKVSATKAKPIISLIDLS
jgi:hypothetical protein